MRDIKPLGEIEKIDKDISTATLYAKINIEFNNRIEELISIEAEELSTRLEEIHNSRSFIDKIFFKAFNTLLIIKGGGECD